MHFSDRASLFVLAAILLPFLAGCDTRNTGATAPTTVTVKPTNDEADSGGGATDSGGGGGDAAVAGFGTLQGRVVFEGNASALPLIAKAGDPIRDANVCSAQPIPNEKLVVASDGGVANVFVYLQKAPRGGVSGEQDLPEVPVIFDQRGCRFIPHALVVRAGQPVNVLNSDGVLHNTHTYPKRNDTFNQGVSPNNRTGIPVVYTRSEGAPIEVKCDIHTWMIAFHLPLDHPYAAVSKEDGSFEIPQLPAGTHKFRVWHEAATGGYLNRNLEVTIKPDEVSNIEIPYPAARFTGN